MKRLVRTACSFARIPSVALMSALLSVGCVSEVPEDDSTLSASAITSPLTSGVAVSGLSASGSSSSDFTLTIPEGTSGVRMEYSGTGYCTLRFNENSPPVPYYTAINSTLLSCGASGTFWNVRPGTLYISLVPLQHWYPDMDGYTNGTVKATLVTTPLPGIASFTIPSPMLAGARVAGKVRLQAPAPFAYQVLLDDNHPAATSFYAIDFNAGEIEKSIDFFSDPVTTSVSGSYTARSGSSSVTTTFAVAPNGTASGTVSKLTVTAKGRSGSTVVSSPVGISVPVGSTRSFDFNTGTVVRLSVSGGRSALWSGGCSSGTVRTTSCTTTMSAAKSVIADVK